MFANPDVQSFIDRMIGGQTPRGGAPPPSPGYRAALARALLGDVTRPSIGGGFSAPPIQLAGGGVTPPLPTQGVNRNLGVQSVQDLHGEAPSGNTGASGLTADSASSGPGSRVRRRRLPRSAPSNRPTQMLLPPHRLGRRRLVHRQGPRRLGVRRLPLLRQPALLFRLSVERVTRPFSRSLGQERG